MRTRSLRAAAATALACGLALTAAGPAAADRPGTDTGGSSNDGTIGADVSFIQYDRHSPGGGTPMTSSSADWSPPPCWFEPRYTNDSLDAHNRELAEDTGSGVEGDVLENRLDMTERARRSGEEGMWWERTPVLSPRECDIGELWIWVENGDPEPPENAVDPEILAGLAYKETNLPAPPVELRPGSDRNIVNLPTKVRFSEPLDRVWTTASLVNEQADLNIAATTVAEPASLRIEAGTEYAEPDVCEYDLVPGDGGYQVNSDGSDCNITYRKSSGDGTYPLEARIVWDVTWSPTASPDGQPQNDDLPDGLSTYEQDVTVKEIQTVVR